MDHQAIIVEGKFNAPVSKVWKSITDKDEMEKWYFELPDFTPKIGFPFQFTDGPSPEKQYLHLCEITEVITEKKLSYSWRYDGYAGNSIVTFELHPQGNITVLRLSHHGIESFPIENKDFAKANFEEGWLHIVNISLKNYLEPVR